MQPFKLFSRLDRAGRVDFRPDVTEFSPSTQLRRLRVYLELETTTEADISDAPQAIGYYREYLYRKVFGGTTHEQFLETDKTDPEAIDWLLAVSAVSDDFYISARKKERN